ncbi:MAG: ATP-grasp domain-containing protein [Ignavibacteriaceae bacterium]
MNNKIVNILLLGGAKRLSLAERFIASGKELNLNVNIFSYELDERLPIAAKGKIIIGKRWIDADVLNHLRKIIFENEIGIVLPCVDPSISISSRLKNDLSEVFIPVSDLSVCELTYDKILANTWLKEIGVPVPANNFELPLIAKLRKGSASQGIVIIKNETELGKFLESNSKEDYLVQKFIDAEEYTVDAYISTNGEFIGAVPRLRIEVISGEVVKAVTKNDKEIITLTEKILASNKFFGPITVQFLREKKSGKLYLMEINPRLGGGVINSIEAGFDIPYFILSEFLGKQVEQTSAWLENLLMIRTYREVFFANYN